MNAFGFPTDLGDRVIAIHKWLRYLRDGNPINEATDAEFLNDIFISVLGYKSPFEPDSRRWELEFEPSPALGFFSETDIQVVAEIFINQINSKLEAKHPSAEWLIVTDYRVIRLYHKSKSMLFYQQFLLEDLAFNLECLKQFYFIMGRRTLLTGTSQSQESSRITKLLEESDRCEAAIADSVYTRYQKIRLQLVKDFRYRLQNSSQPDEQASNQEQINLEAILKSQKLLNRILLIAFCEDSNLLPDTLLANAYNFCNPYIAQPVWENYKAIFNWISQGNAKFSPPINQLGSELFELDEILDKFLFVGDELCRQIKELTKFSFEEEVSDTVIAYILEESVKDLSLLKEDGTASIKRRKSRYPPKSLLSSDSVLWMLRSHLDRKAINKEEIESEFGEDSETKILNRQLGYWKLRQQYLLNLRVVDPKCRAGTYLAIAFDFLLFEYEKIEYEISKLSNEIKVLTKQEMAISILQKNLYGCDLLPECVEITKLHLWLRTVHLVQPLIDLNKNIQLGDLKSCSFDFDLNDSLVLN